MNIGVNVLTKTLNGDVYPTYISNADKPKHIINLLLFYIGQSVPKLRKKSNIEISRHFYEDTDDINQIQEEEKLLASTIQHYALIENLEREVSKARKCEQMTRSFELQKQIQNKLSRLKIRETEKKEIEILQNDLKKIEQHIKNLEKLHSEDSNIRRQACVCYNCLNIFSNQSSLDNHKKWCFKEKPTLLMLPVPGEKMKFDPKRKTAYSRFQMFFDFECVQVEPKFPCACRPEFNLECQESISKQYVFCKHGTKIIKEQKPFAYCLIVCSNEFEVLDVVEYVGEDASYNFIGKLLDMEEKYMKLLSETCEKMIFTRENEKSFNEAKKCHICELDFLPGETKYRDHGKIISYFTRIFANLLFLDHFNGMFLGASHNECNLQRRENTGKLVAYAHNFR